MANILVVDDNSAVRMAYRLLLAAHGHAVTEAGGGAEAIEAVGRTRFDLVVTDLWMPAIDGFQVIAATRRLSPETPVLAITGGVAARPGHDPVARAREAGADAVIEKPMLGAGLLEAVDALIGR